MGQTNCYAFGAFLQRRAEPIGFAFRSHARGHSAQKSAGHSKDVGVKAMRVHHVDFLLFDETHHPPDLPGEVEIIKAGQRVFVDLSEAKLISLSTERTAILQTGEINPALAAGVQLTQKL